MGEGTNWGFTLSITPLRKSKSKHILEANRSLLWNVLSRWRDRLYIFKTSV